MLTVHDLFNQVAWKDMALGVETLYSDSARSLLVPGRGSKGSAGG